MTEKEIALAHQCESSGHLKNAINHYTNALQLYEVQLTGGELLDVEVLYYIAEHTKLITARIVMLRDTIKNGGGDDYRDTKTTSSCSTASHMSQQMTPSSIGAIIQPQNTTRSAEETRMRDEITALFMSPAAMDSIQMNDVIGMDNVKRFIRLAVEIPRKLKHVYGGNRVAPTSLLMYGPPGVGKTFIVKAIARQCECNFLPIKCSSIVSKYVGDTPKYVKAMFDVAKSNKPCILFIDEIEQLCPERDSSSSSKTSSGSGDSGKTMSEFLQQLDGITDCDMTDVLLIGATNLPWDIDEAARRRFSRLIYTPLPATAERYQLLKHRLAKNCDDVGHAVSDDETWQLAEATLNYSSSDLMRLINAAYDQTIEDLMEAQYFRTAWEKKSGKMVMVPCAAGDEGACALSCQQVLTEEGDDVVQLRPNGVTFQYMMDTTRRVKSSIDLSKLVLYEAFTAKYGEASAH
jgi:vacuolar protein-sorting-associated protein 4